MNGLKATELYTHKTVTMVNFRLYIFYQYFFKILIGMKRSRKILPITRKKYISRIRSVCDREMMEFIDKGIETAVTNMFCMLKNAEDQARDRRYFKKKD